MALSTNPKVWKILLVISLILTFLFAVLFYFSTIFITFAIGIGLILIVEKLMKDYQRRMAKYKFSKWKKKIMGYALIILWLYVIILLLGTSLNELGDAVSKFKEGETVSGQYVMKLNKYIPQISGEKIIKESTIKKAETYIFSFFSDVFSSFTRILASAVLIIPL